MRSKYEIQAQLELESEGWRVDNKAGMGRWSKNRDFFNLFDLVAQKKNKPMRYIAIKGHNTGTVITTLKGQIEEFWMPKGCVKELWRWPKRKKKVECWVKEIIN